MSRKRRQETPLSSEDGDGYDTKEVQSSKKEAYKMCLDKTYDKSRYSDEDRTHRIRRHKKSNTKYNFDRTKSKANKNSDRSYTDEDPEFSHRKPKSNHSRCIESSIHKRKVSKNFKPEDDPCNSDENVHDEFKSAKPKHNDIHRSKRGVDKYSSYDRNRSIVDEGIHALCKKSKGKRDHLDNEISNRSKSNKEANYERSQLRDSENSHSRKQDDNVINKMDKTRLNKDVSYDEESMNVSFKNARTNYNTFQRCNVESEVKKKSFSERSVLTVDENIEDNYENRIEAETKHVQKVRNYKTVNETDSSTSRNDKRTGEMYHSTSSINISDEPQSKRIQIQTINLKTGGAYIPPAKLKMMQDRIKDKGGEEYQRIAWEALKKSIVGMTNKVNVSNITEIVPELFKENIIRGRGILARAIMQAQAASPSFTRVYAALMGIINTKFPEIGELILKRLILQYRRGFRRNDKTACLSACRFVAHLFNQEVAHEVLILEMLTHLLENPTEDSVEIAIALLKECGEKLTKLSKHGMRAITDRIRSVLHDAKLDVRVRYMIEVFFAVQKDGFKDYVSIPKELDLVEENDKYTHLVNLDEVVDGEDILNVFKFDPNYIENEDKYKSVVKEILGDSSSSEESGDDSDQNADEEGWDNKVDEGQQIIDMTETNIVCLRRKIYLTIQSSLDFEECAHKLLKLELKPGQILEMCYMILDCCAQQRTYEKFFGLLAQRFCQINKVYAEPFTEIFENSYKTIHRLETNKLRNVANFFAHLLYTDAISWMVLSNIRLNEDDTSSSSRVFIKILFQELCEYMGLSKLNERVKDVTYQEAFDGLFPRDHPHNTRFAINFFTSIGLGGLTDELREHLKNMPKKPVAPAVTTNTGIPVESSDSDSETVTHSSPKKKKKLKKTKK